MSTPEELLCSRRWRLRNGLWMLWGILSVGLLACVGWLYVGVKSRNRLFLIVGGVLLAYSVASFAAVGVLDLPGKDETGTSTQERQSSVMGGVTATVWIASSVGAWFANRKWLVWRAHHNEKTPWYGTATSTPPQNVAPDPQQISVAIDNAFATADIPQTQFQPGWYPVEDSSQERYHDGSRYTHHVRPSAVSAPVSGNAGPAPATDSITVLDLNSASAAQLAALPGLDPATAAHVVSVRAQFDGFSDTADLVTKAGVKPHVFAAIQERVTVADRGRPAAPPRSQNREGGRRLEF